MLTNPENSLVSGVFLLKNLFGFHVRRAIHLLTVAASKKADTLVLGAFGCGAFQNNPKIVARAYKAALQEFEGVFRKIEFAVYCSSRDTEKYTVFAEITVIIANYLITVFGYVNLSNRCVKIQIYFTAQIIIKIGKNFVINISAKMSY